MFSLVPKKYWYEIWHRHFVGFMSKLCWGRCCGDWWESLHLSFWCQGTFGLLCASHIFLLPLITGPLAYIPVLWQRMDIYFTGCDIQEWIYPGKCWKSQNCCLRFEVTHPVNSIFLSCDLLILPTLKWDAAKPGWLCNGRIQDIWCGLLSCTYLTLAMGCFQFLSI